MNDADEVRDLRAQLATAERANLRLRRRVRSLELRFLELERLGLLDGSIPCSSCGEPVYDDDANAHIDTQRIPCQEVSV